MDASDWFSRRRPREQAGELLDTLIAARSAQQFELMVQLITSNSETIHECFAEWMTAAEEIRNDPEAMNRDGQTLFVVARVFEDSGDPSLMTRFGAGPSPARALDRDLATARTLVEGKRAAEAVTLLTAALASLDNLGGKPADYYRPRVLGHLGDALLHTGDRRAAAKVTKEALELCQSIGDEEGIRAYTHILGTIGTHHMPANDGTDATVSVVFHDAQGRPLTLDEVGTQREKVSWKACGDGSLPPEAKRLHDEGRAAGSRGDYDTALSLLTRAAELAPGWPFPVYDRAFTYLWRDDFESALRDFTTAIELSPGGFFQAEVAVDTLTRESAGEFARGLYLNNSLIRHRWTHGCGLRSRAPSLPADSYR